MQRYWLLLIMLLGASGCSAHKTDAALAAAPADAARADAARDASSSGDEPASGSGGHLHLTGATTLERDFAVEQCAIAPPGDGLLSGYRMNAKDGDAPIQLLSIVVKDYIKDGSYAPADKTAAGQVGAAMTSGVMGPLTLMLAQGDSAAPLAVMLAPASKLSIAISGDGAKGDAEFTDMETPPSMADMRPGERPHGKKISGSVTWSCGKIDRLDPKMNEAVNGMFKKLIPPAGPPSN